MSEYSSIITFHKALYAGSISCTESVRYYLDRIAQLKHLNAFLEIYENEALEKAQELDNRIKNGEKLGALAGVVVGIKDVICYKGHNVSAASRILEGFTSMFSATAVERLLAEDAIIIGNLT